MSAASTSPNLPPRAGIKAIGLVLGVLLLIGAFIVYVLTARGFFEETQRLVLLTDNSEGIRPGMDLGFSGFPVGRVRRVELASDGNVRILIDVPLKDAHWLRDSSVFTLERSLVGDTRLRAFSAQLDDPPLAADAVRQVLRGDAGEQIPQVMSTAKALLENLERLSAADAPLTRTIANAETLSSRMLGPYGALPALLGSDAEAKKLVATVERSNALLAAANQRLFADGGLADDAGVTLGEITALLRDARQTMQRVDTILLDARAIAANVRSGTDELDQLRSEVERSLRQSGRLLDDINRKWPFARDSEIKLP